MRPNCKDTERPGRRLAAGLDASRRLRRVFRRGLGAVPGPIFQGPVKQLVFQAFGVQPAVSVAEKATRNILEGRPTQEGLGEAYGEGVVGTLTPAPGHAALNRILIRSAPPAPPPEEFPEGSFSISNWAGYPSFAPRPTGPFRLLTDEEYEAARSAADRINAHLRKADPPSYANKHIHEIHPVKFGGDPVDQGNKIRLAPADHRMLNAWWYRLQRDLERGKPR
jgi:hypothetical protein